MEKSEVRNFCHPNKDPSHIPIFFGENGFVGRDRGFCNKFL